MTDTPAPLFSGTRQYESFCRMSDFYPSKGMKASSCPRPFPAGAPISLPKNYSFEGQLREITDLIEHTHTSALLVIHDGQMRFESYSLTGGKEVRWVSWSVAKSFVSALVGIAIEQGAIRSIEDPISDYWPDMKGSAYEGVAIRHVLQMSSGARWNEDYSDAKSSVNQLGVVLAGEGTFDEFVCGIAPESAPGSLCRYNSADTQALGMLLRGATGEPLADYMSRSLLEPLGMEDPSFWITDNSGTEMVLGGLNMTARDFAKIGELYRNGGKVAEKQLVPASWVNASTHIASPHLAPGQVTVGGHKFAFGYAYQWWIPSGDLGEFSAIGIYNQFVYVDPSSRTTIVKLSANPSYGISENEADNKDEENMELLRTISRSLS